MNEKMPRTPFSTPLSGSAKETEIRLRNIFSGPKKRPPFLFLILMFSICILCGNLVSCHIREETAPDVSDPASSSQENSDPDAPLNALILDYFQTEYSCTAYLAKDIPAEPQERDSCLDSVHMIGMDYVGDELYVLYQVNRRGYFQRQGELQWSQFAPAYLVCHMDGGGVPAELLAAPYDGPLEDMSSDEAIRQVHDTIRQTVWGLTDLEVCLFRDGYPTPIGPGNWYELFPDLQPTVEVHEDWEPIHWPGDYWDEWNAEGLTAQRHYNVKTDNFSINSLDVTRSDLYTPTGIRVGSTRAEVLEAYPDAKAKNYWDLYPGEDMLYYIPGSGPDDTAELGCALLFFLEGDTVRQITLYDMFN